ncbi:MAG: CobW family GTP-binding protein [Lachnospiraceae bacterium]|jgi:G3E family GTPase|nr:CobW family GTP-binding protein [Lachnospiraceae bacterium]
MATIDIISGFLGAGKTTLIKKLLAGPLKGQQVVLIENEFGEIGIDGGFLKDAGIEIREMNSGCICCSLVGDFGTALKEVTEQYHPERVLIEPSGVGKLSDVIRAVQRNAEEAHLEIGSATTVVDVTKAKMYMKNFGEFFKNQIEAAGTIILSRMDTPKATDEKVQEVLAMIREINPNATIITTPVEQLSGEKVLDTMEGRKIDLTAPADDDDDDDDACCHHHHHDGEDGHEHHHHDDDEEDEHHHHDHDEDEHDHHEHHHHHHHHGHDADDVFISWGKETIRKYTQDEIRSILKTLSEDRSYGMVLRAKGMVEAKDGSWIYFDMVPEEADVRSGAPEYTGRICVIGSDLKEDKLAELFGIA